MIATAPYLLVWCQVVFRLNRGLSRIYRIARILSFRVFNVFGIALGFTQFARDFNKRGNYPNHTTKEKTRSE